MNKYSIDFYFSTSNGQHFLCGMEFERERLTGYEYHNFILPVLTGDTFILTDPEIHNITAIVNRNGKQIMRFCSTYIEYKSGREFAVAVARNGEKYQQIRF